MRKPYWIRIRHTTTKPEVIHAGDDVKKGIETLMATEQGAVVVRVKREQGIEMLKVDLIPWTDFRGQRVGVEQEIFRGSIGALPISEQLKLIKGQ